MNSAIRIRTMVSEDAQAVGALWYALSKHHEPFHPYYAVKPQGERELILHVHELIRRDCIGFVAEREGVIFGFVTGYIVRRNPQLQIERVGKVDNIFVSEASRGDGVGSKLLEELISFFNRQGVTFVEISCDIQNPSALRLYKRLGFEEQKVLLVKKCD